MAIVWATKYFRPYLFGKKFKIITDHKPLQWLLSLKEPNSRFVRWRLKLEEFNYEIIYEKGKQNTNADALSRIDINTIENKEDSLSLAVNLVPMEQLDQTDDDYLNDPNKIPVPDSPSISNLIQDKTESKIKILSDIQIKPPDDTNATVHSSIENSIQEIPIIERALNI